MARLFGAKLHLRIGFRPIGLSLHAVNPTQTVGVIHADMPTHRPPQIRKKQHRIVRNPLWKTLLLIEWVLQLHQRFGEEPTFRHIRRAAARHRQSFREPVGTSWTAVSK
jgi:hypothetical protein